MATSTAGNINDMLFGGTPLEISDDFVFDDEEFESLFDTEVHSAVKEVSLSCKDRLPIVLCSFIF